MHWVTFATIALIAYALVDVITTDSHLIRYLPKLVWLIVVIFVPILGPVTWLLLGRPRGGSLLPGTIGGGQAAPGRNRQPLAPDDDPDFLRRLGDPRDDR